MAKENKEQKKALLPTESPSSAADQEAKAKHGARNEHLLAFFMIVLGLFLSLSITTPAMGIVGQAVSYLTGALIGRLGILLSIALFGLGTARFLFPDRRLFEKISRGMVGSLLVLSFLLYGWMYMGTVLEQPLSFQEIQKTWIYSAAGDAMGIFPYLFTLLLTKLIGKAGMVLVTLALLLFTLFHYFHLATWVRPALQGRKTPAQEEYSANPEPKNGWWSRLKVWMEDFVFEKDVPGDTQWIQADFSQKSPQRKSVLWTLDKQEAKEKNPARDDGAGASAVQAPKEMRKMPTYEEFCEGGLLDGYPLPGNEGDKNPDFFMEEQGMEKEAVLLEAEPSEKPYTYEDLRELKTEAEALRQRNRAQAGAKSSPKQGRGEAPTPEEETAKEYVLPPLWLLKEKKQQKQDMTERNRQAKLLEETLGIFGIEATVTNIAVGPSITRYELQPKAGTKVSKIVNLADDLSLALASQSIRIEAPIPGKSLVGIEVANKISEMVDFRSVIETPIFREEKSLVSFALGKDVTGEIIVANLAAMPHLLVAGSTGSGKSVCINTIICSILCRANPDQVKFIMIDPKMVELANYNDIPHLLIPVVTDMKKAPYALNWAVGEMNRRYKLFSENRVKDIFSYNEKFPQEPLSNIVIIVDELADLMLVSPKDVEDAICRIAQMARACGMHLVIATQRPSVDVITGLIKANIPSRIAFAVSSQTDSRTILDMGGAEKLLGKGDSLYYPIGMNKPKRVQGAFISEKEVQNIVAFIKEQSGEVEAGPDIIQEAQDKEDEERDQLEEDPLLKEVIKFAVEQGKVSTSLVQRRFRIGYNRASRMVEDLEHKGIIGPSNGVRPREVLIDSVEEEE